MDRTGDTLLIASFYGNLAQMYYELGKFKQSVKGYLKTRGMSLMRGLNKQLNRKLQISQNEGVQITLTVREITMLRETLSTI